MAAASFLRIFFHAIRRGFSKMRFCPVAFDYEIAHKNPSRNRLMITTRRRTINRSCTSRGPMLTHCAVKGSCTSRGPMLTHCAVSSFVWSAGSWALVRSVKIWVQKSRSTQVRKSCGGCSTRLPGASKNRARVARKFLVAFSAYITRSVFINSTKGSKIQKRPPEIFNRLRGDSGVIHCKVQQLIQGWKKYEYKGWTYCCFAMFCHFLSKKCTSKVSLVKKGSCSEIFNVNGRSGD